MTVTPSDSGASVKIDGMFKQPRILKKAMDKFPKDLWITNWSGVAMVKCTISLEGKCSKMEIVDSPNLPPSARKFALGSMKAWRFKMQKVNGMPVPYVLTVPFSFHSEDMFPDDFIGRY
jgi:outer membrane biosynthesis protein TonB